MDEIQTYLGADGLMHCTVCKEPVEAFYPKGSLLEMKKHHRQCACERQAYAEEAQYFKEKERRELAKNETKPYGIFVLGTSWNRKKLSGCLYCKRIAGTRSYRENDKFQYYIK